MGGKSCAKTIMLNVPAQVLQDWPIHSVAVHAEQLLSSLSKGNGQRFQDHLPELHYTYSPDFYFFCGHPEKAYFPSMTSFLQTINSYNGFPFANPKHFHIYLLFFSHTSQNK